MDPADFRTIISVRAACAPIANRVAHGEIDDQIIAASDILLACDLLLDDESDSIAVDLATLRDAWHALEQGMSIAARSLARQITGL